MERKVFDYRDVEEAREYIGKHGIASDNLADAALGLGHPGVLEELYVPSKNRTFKVDSYFQFFSPDPEPIEKWVPFTVEDGELFKGRWVYGKSILTPGGTMIVSYGHQGVILAGRTPTLVDYEDLIKEYSFSDNTPCGKKILTESTE